MSEDTSETLSNLLHENRKFPPPEQLAADANVKADAYDEADRDRLAFWEKQAERLTWDTKWTQALDWSDAPVAKWFVGGKLNVAYNCVDRHVEAGHGDQVAYHWEGEPGDTRSITYAELKDLVCQAANALADLGVKAGDRVAIYLPMIPETVVAMLACARLGALHTVVFGGFSSTALSDRIIDCDARVVITADGGYRRGAPSALKPAVDEALQKCPDVRSVLVVRRTEQDVDWTDGRDVWWDDVVAKASTEHTCEFFDSEHPLFVMYTSGSTGKPKGILHTSGGYLTQAAYTHHAVFDLKPDSDLYWCGADIGWITGHSYIVYGPLANRATSFMYEGTPNTPTEHRWWEMIEKYKITILYTAPTTIRTFMKWGEDVPKAHDLSSLRMLGSVGEPINPEAWMWYRLNIGGDRCPIVDTWWQTETGAIMISPLPGVTETKPGSAMRPLPGVNGDVVDNEGKAVPERWRRVPRADRAVAVDDTRHLGRPGQVQGDVLGAVQRPGLLLRRRRREEGRGRRPLAARPRRRRHERLRAPHLDHRGRVGAGVAPVGGRGGRGRCDRPDNGPGHRRVRHPARQRHRGVRGRRAGQDTAQSCGQGDRRDRQAAPDHGRARSCPRLVPGRSCGGCCATWPITASSATSRP